MSKDTNPPIRLSEEEFANLKAACEAPPRITPHLEDAIRRSREIFSDHPRVAEISHKDGATDA
jgi:hypothetical protein